MLAPSGNNLYLGSGVLYFDQFSTTGTKTGELHLGNCTTFSVGTTEERKEITSSMSKDRGKLASVLTKRTLDLKITGNEFSLENLALVLAGSGSSIAQTGATVTAETITASSKAGRYYPTAKRKISAVAVKVGAATKTVGTDYTVDAETGRIYIVPGGGITDGSTVTADYTYATVTIQTVQGATAGNTTGYLRFISDPANGPVLEVEIWKVNLSPDGELGLISDEFGTWTLKGEILADLTAHPTEPYYRVLQRA